MNDQSKLEFFIKSENDKVENSLPKDFMTLKALIQIIVRAMDIFYSQSYKEDDENNTMYYELGHIKALNFLIGPAIEQPGWITTPVDANLWDWANSFIVHCGKIALIERLLLYQKAGITNLIYTQNDNLFEFRYISRNVDIEKIDRNAAKWYKQVMNDGFSKPNLDALLSQFDTIELKLSKIVKVWNNHMIQYQYDDVEIDYYYQKLAFFRSSSMLNQDLFPPNSLFNGIPYEKFISFAELNMAISMKHKDFCMALIKKESAIKLPDIITLFCSKSETIKNTSIYLNITLLDAEILVNSLILDLENKEYHINREVSPSAPFIQIGTDSLMMSSFGCEGNPYYFLNNELKRTFETNYFKAVNEREAYFRDQLYYIFDNEKYVKVNKSIVIKIKGLHTDIDGALLNISTGTLALFQLKWQDPFGKSMKQRNSRIKNFFSKTVEWIDKIFIWINTNDEKTILSSLGINSIYKINKVHIFVVNRNAARFSGQIHDERVAWCSWYQLLNFNSKIPLTEIDDLDYLYNLLTQKDETPPEIWKQESYSFNLSDHNFILKSAV